MPSLAMMTAEKVTAAARKPASTTTHTVRPMPDVELEEDVDDSMELDEDEDVPRMVVTTPSPAQDKTLPLLLLEEMEEEMGSHSQQVPQEVERLEEQQDPGN
jgi:hypothetical protein